MLQQGAAHCEGGMTETGNLSNFRFLQSEGCFGVKNVMIGPGRFCFD